MKLSIKNGIQLDTTNEDPTNYSYRTYDHHHHRHLKRRRKKKRVNSDRNGSEMEKFSGRSHIDS